MLRPFSVRNASEFYPRFGASAVFRTGKIFLFGLSARSSPLGNIALTAPSPPPSLRAT
jgi:hypothetical protein